MSQLFETIKCLDGNLFNLEYHQSRFDSARKNYFGVSKKADLNEVLEVPENCRIGLYRCRITYSEKIEKIEFLPHHIRKIETLRLVEDNDIDYQFKYNNRERLNKLFGKRENCDDILIVKNGFITDSSTANTIFFDGEKWWTPNTPLLKGTQRSSLIDEGKITECVLKEDEILKFKMVGLINAMQDFDSMPIIKTENIKFR